MVQYHLKYQVCFFIFSFLIIRQVFKISYTICVERGKGREGIIETSLYHKYTSILSSNVYHGLKHILRYAKITKGHRRWISSGSIVEQNSVPNVLTKKNNLTICFFLEHTAA